MFLSVLIDKVGPKGPLLYIIPVLGNETRLVDKLALFDLNAAFEFLKKDPACNGKISVVGFCWSGSQTFRYATNNPELKEACVFYGTAPKEAAEFETINCPVYGFYGGADNRVNATIPDTEKAMKQYGHTYDYVVYESAGHAFMRRGSEAEADAANKKAHDQAWQRLLEVLEE